jgi:hypothetical protein
MIMNDKELIIGRTWFHRIMLSLHSPEEGLKKVTQALGQPAFHGNSNLTPDLKAGLSYKFFFFRLKDKAVLDLCDMRKL